MTDEGGWPRGVPHTLQALRWRWGDAYDINWDCQQKVYRAVRADNGGVLEAEAIEELWSMIRRDYTRNPVPRDTRGSA